MPRWADMAKFVVDAEVPGFLIGIDFSVFDLDRKCLSYLHIAVLKSLLRFCISCDLWAVSECDVLWSKRYLGGLKQWCGSAYVVIRTWILNPHQPPCGFGSGKIWGQNLFPRFQTFTNFRFFVCIMRIRVYITGLMLGRPFWWLYLWTADTPMLGW